MDFWKVLEGGYGISQGQKEELLEINEHFIHSKEYGFIVVVSHKESALPRGGQFSTRKNNLIK